MMTKRSTAELQRLDLAHHLHPFTDHPELAVDKPLVIERAQGIYLYDTDGRRLLDGMGGLWCMNVGYGRSEIVAAVASQMNELPFYNTFFKTSTPPVILLSERLAQLVPAGIRNFFYTNSGSEANDTNIRLVQTYWRQVGQSQRRMIISRDNAYHGSTIAAAALTGMASMHDIPAVGSVDFAHILQPHWYALGGDRSEDEFGLIAARALEQKILELGADRVAAFFAEPVQGAGGVIVPPATYWPEIQRICRKYDVLLVADEVVCGFGRTGRWFGCDTYGITPDIITLAKGLSSGYLPIAACGVGERVSQVLRAMPGRFPHGFTYSGHPVAAAAALANIDILTREGIVEQVGRTTGPYFQAALGRLRDHPLVGQVRGVGMMAAVELSSDKQRRAPFDPVGSVSTRVRNLCFERGLVTRAVYDGLVFSPPLVITPGQCDELVGILQSCLDTVLVERGHG
jgi:putrescine aminotransferase